MSQQLSYVLISPYSMYKSRTGGILARLMSRTALDLVAARMFAPSEALIKEYADTIRLEGVSKQQARVLELIRHYLLAKLMPDPRTGQRRRAIMLLFQGENAVEKIARVAGTVTFGPRVGETIRDTYGDLIVGSDGKVTHFEPAVLVPLTKEEAVEDIKIWARYSDTDGGLLENVISYPPGTQVERTLALIKPDNFKFASGRPGNILDMFSGTGLFIVGFKVHRMSVAEAEEFYAPVREVLRAKAAESVGLRAKNALEREFGFTLPESAEKQIAEALIPYASDHHFGQIIKFMAGRAPSECGLTNKRQCGTEKCIAVVYEGPGAVKKIRSVLGPTDPRKAPPGTVRRELGQDIMVNAAHASDSPENARHEIQIVNVGENNFKKVVEESYGKL